MNRKIRINARLFLAVSVVAAIFMLHGCGKKDNPLPLDVPLPKQVADLKVVPAEDGIAMRWKAPDNRENVIKYKIHRSDIDLKGKECLDCPREYAVIAEVAVNDPILVKGEGNIFYYLDRKVSTGFSYSYRVAACKSSDLCGETTEAVEIKY